MIPAPFSYVRADSVAHAVQLLGQHGDDAKHFLHVRSPEPDASEH
ncbi:hypothetical protein ACTXG6_33675 [Pseudonocardia sp. Cha107L01]